MTSVDDAITANVIDDTPAPPPPSVGPGDPPGDA